MPLVLSVVPNDELYDTLLTILGPQFLAFKDEAIHEILFPGPATPANLRATRDHIWSEVKGHLDRTTYVIVTDKDTGAFAAMARWSMYADHGNDRWKRIKADWYGEESSAERAYAQYWMDVIMKMRTKLIGDAPLMLLDLIFTHPDYQRRGAGTQVVQWGCRRADELGVQAVVEATVMGSHLYKKNGFAVEDEVFAVKEYNWPGKGLNHWYFMRRPKQAP